MRIKKQLIMDNDLVSEKNKLRTLPMILTSIASLRSFLLFSDISESSFQKSKIFAIKKSLQGWYEMLFSLNYFLFIPRVNQTLTYENKHATSVSAAEIDIDYILDERVRELYGEEWRLIILRRTGKLLERVLKYNDNPMCPGALIKPHNFRWPIPQAQIDLNVDAEFPQNPGY